MPRTYQKVVGSRSYVNYSEDDVAKAMQQITSGEMSQRDAAGHFGIPRSTLKNKLKGKHSKPIGGQTVLSKTEEEVISNCCISMSIYGFPVDTFDLRCTVKSHLDRRGSKVEKFTNNLPGKEWTQSFLRRHRELTMRFASNIKRKRAQVSLESITDYFEHLSAELEGIPATHIWNYDETNLTDDPGNKRVIAKRGSKYPERIINATKAATSLMFCGSANGQILPPYVVYKAESMWCTWTENGPTGTRYNRSKSGWFDALCFEDWFCRTLLPALQKIPGKHILIGDNLSSHINPNVLDLCRKNNISFIALPPNSTHLTQPLDVAYFHLMKIAWRAIITNWKTKGKGRKAPCIPKDEFPKLLNQLMAKMSQNGANNLISGFRKTGIYPLNKQVVLDRLPTTHLSGGQEDHANGITDSFLEHLQRIRAGDDEGPQRKRKKITVIPGKSITEEDVQIQLEHRTKKLAKKSSEVIAAATEPIAYPAPTCPSGSGSSEAGPSSPVNRDQVGDDQVESLTDDLENDAVGSDAESYSDFSEYDNDGGPLNESKNVVSVDTGNYVIVNYDGIFYPGVITEVKKSGAKVCVMSRSGFNWKWPSKRDEIFYSKDEIVANINVPQQISNRGVYKVPEMEKYL